MSDIRQMYVAMQRLVDLISMVTNSTLLCNNIGASSTLLRNNTGANSMLLRSNRHYMATWLALQVISITLFYQFN
jgi:hypothetical protein